MHIARIGYLAKYYLQSKLGHKKPILGGIKLTHRCTLQCRQCPYWRRPSTEMNYQQVVALMDQFYQEGVRIIIFEGGEPLLWTDGERNIHDLVAAAKERFYTVGLTTNGTLPIDVQTDVVWVSVDGLRDTHDALRGKSFERIINNLRNSHHPKIFVNITINKLNCKEVPSLVEYVAPLVQGITVQFFYPYSESEDLLLSWDDRQWVLDQLIALKKQGQPISDSLVALEGLKHNSWRCEPWMLINADPNGEINRGCYLQNRMADQNPCGLCGFAAHAEISLAYQLNLGAIWAGRNILGLF